MKLRCTDHLEGLKDCPGYMVNIPGQNDIMKCSCCGQTRPHGFCVGFDAGYRAWMKKPEKCIGCTYWKDPSKGHCTHGDGDEYCVKEDKRGLKWNVKRMLSAETFLERMALIEQLLKMYKQEDVQQAIENIKKEYGKLIP